MSPPCTSRPLRVSIAAPHVAFKLPVQHQPLLHTRDEHIHHYWWFNSRDYKPGDANIDTFLTYASTQAYSKDVQALEWIMDVVRDDANPQIDLGFAPDKPGLMARRIMYRLATKEMRS